jgi:hypothetical protein
MSEELPRRVQRTVSPNFQGSCSDLAPTHCLNPLPQSLIIHINTCWLQESKAKELMSEEMPRRLRWRNAETGACAVYPGSLLMARLPRFRCVRVAFEAFIYTHDIFSDRQSSF